MKQMWMIAGVISTVAALFGMFGILFMLSRLPGTSKDDAMGIAALALTPILFLVAASRCFGLAFDEFRAELRQDKEQK